MHRFVPAVVLGVALGAVCLAQTPAGQTPAVPPAKLPATGIIAGTVVDASTDKPIGGAIVSISGTALADSSRVTSRQVLTGSDGRYLFMQLPAGVFLVTASQGGYLAGGVGVSTRGSTGAQVALADGETRPDTKLALRRPASISGIVVDEAGEPVIGAQVGVLLRARVRGRATWSSGGTTETTDDRGMYRISGLMPGDYLVVVEQTNATVPTAAVDESQKQTEARVAGTEFNSPPVLTELLASGGPTSGAGTSGTRMVNGQLQMLSRSTAQPGIDATGRMFVYPTTVYPAATSGAKGTVVTVKSGEDRSGIDITLRPVKTSSVSGVILGPDGPASFTAVTLVPSDSSVAFFRWFIGQVGTTTDARGAFTFAAVPAGDYTLKCLRVPALPASPMVMNTVQMGDGSTRMTASSSMQLGTPPLPPDPTLYVELPVSVGVRDVSGLNVTLRSGAHITGRVRFAGAIKQPTAQEMHSMNVIVSPPPDTSLFGRAPRVRVDGTGEITSQGFAPGQYSVTAVGAPQGWALQSVIVDGVDVTQKPLDIGVSDITGMVVTFTDTPAELTGSVTGRDGSPAKEAAVIAFPADEPIAHDYGLNPRRVVSTRTVTSGAFAFRNLPPGDYQVVAVDDIVKAFDLSPEFIQSLTGRATHVKVSAGAKAQQTLQLVSIK